MASPLQDALEAVVRPLEFAARDDFAQVQRVQGLAGTVVAACQRARRLALPPDLDQRLESVEKLFADCDGESSEEADAGDRESREVARQVNRTRSALETLAPVSRAGWVDVLLDRSPAELVGVGPKRAALLARRGIATIADLLFTFPIRYDDRRALLRVGDLQVGSHATFIAQVKTVGSSRRRGRYGKTLEAVVADESDSVVLKWFRYTDGLESRLKPGVQLCVTGDVRRYRFSIELIHPEIEVLGAGDSGERKELSSEASLVLDGMRRIVPAYSTPEGIPPRTLRRLVELAVEQYSDAIPGHLPAELVRQRGLAEPSAALRAIHAPESADDADSYVELVSPAHERLVLEELYLLELGLVLRRAAQIAQPGIAIDVGDEMVRRAPGELPFELTGAQRRSWGEIAQDLAQPHPMSRLLQGDVGSGKTAVAYLAAVAVARSGHQTALMAPTELLAEQHARTLVTLSAELSAPLRCALLTASVPRRESETVREGLREGSIDLVVGTSALVQEDIAFASLALSITDEQHRFGVMQRAALAGKAPPGRVPHALVMTATPIPRTLALTLYGDLAVSVIDELPPGRNPIDTLLLRKGEGERVVELIRACTGRGEQVYVVYPLVEESEKIDLRAAVESAKRIANAFGDLRVDLVHGRQKSVDRAAVMARFESGEIDILVSTSVIEVGVDIANATLIVVEHAERFGLAQLHQLRGRVGRGVRPGTCLLVSRGGGEESEARLRAMLETTDGFRIADADLRIRGPGEFLGTQQSGHLPDLRIADLVRDAELVRVARDAAQRQVKRDPGLRGEPGLRQAVEARWGDRLALVGVG